MRKLSHLALRRIFTPGAERRISFCCSRKLKRPYYLLHALFYPKQSALQVIRCLKRLYYLYHALSCEKQSALQRMVKRKKGLPLEVNRSLVRQSPFFAFLLDITVYPDKMIMNFIFICCFMEYF